MDRRGGLFSGVNEGLELAFAPRRRQGPRTPQTKFILPTSASERRSCGRVTAGYFLPHWRFTATGFDGRKRKRVHEKGWSTDPLRAYGARAYSERSCEKARSSLRKLRWYARVRPMQRGGSGPAGGDRDVSRCARRRPVSMARSSRSLTAGSARRSDEEPRSVG